MNQQWLVVVFVLLLLAACAQSEPAENMPPRASFTATPDSGQAPLEVEFDASASHDPDGTITAYDWDFGDGGTGSGATVSHAYEEPGSYTAQLTVTDNHHAVDTATATITVTTAGEGGDEDPDEEDPGEGDEAVKIQASPSYLAFPGTSASTVELTADGAWTAESEQSWLEISPSAGSGDATVSITIERNGLSPDHYAGSVLFKGASAREVVTVYMRFPNISGHLVDQSDQISSNGLTAAADIASLPHVPGEVLVKLKRPMIAVATGSAPENLATAAAGIAPAVMQQAAMQLAKDYELRGAQPLAPAGSVFLMSTPRGLAETVEALTLDGRVELVQPNRLNTRFGTPDDPFYPDQWHYQNVNLPGAWEYATGSPNVTVAVIDSAVDIAHPDLAGRLVEGYDFITNTTAIQSPPDDHGTHVAGTIGAASNNGMGVAGVTWQGNVMPLNVFEGDTATDADIYRAIAFAAGLCVTNSDGKVVCNSEPADVINLSIGAYNPYCQAMPTDPVYSEAVAFALGNGATLVAAAGNDDCNVVSIPAALDGVIAVSATNRTDAKASYSNYGPEIWVSAPGGEPDDPVLATLAGGGYGHMAGTSMASPHVAGIAALMKAANPDLTPTEIALILAETATDLGASGWDPYYGYGLVDAEAAVQLARKLLGAHFRDFTIRLLEGSNVIQEVRADADGTFLMKNVAVGSYKLEAGTDRNHRDTLGEPGEFYGATGVTVSYSGDKVGVGISVAPE